MPPTLVYAVELSASPFFVEILVYPGIRHPSHYYQAYASLPQEPEKMGNRGILVEQHSLEPWHPSVRAQRQPVYARKPFVFHHKQKRGRNVGKRELVEKHYRRAFNTMFLCGGNRLLDNVLSIVPERPYPKLPHHVYHYKRDWKGQRCWLQEETAYEAADLKGDYSTKTARYCVSKPPKFPGWYL
ncbi:hypothetical protein PG993_002277 [Apiospora rasikravindrae]|uniref:Uncharacterized protein n=1 Tax=Apiospora rasikravindrae TaxID=990691 RepID=A0ABR1TWE3_9PEZI